jgi:regulation of enolase protein 1 (concanavalin A-like superfamily)
MERSIMNLLENVATEGLGKLSWFNETEWEPLPGGGLRVHAGAKTDFFQNPNGDPGTDSGHLLWVPVTGDFVAQAHVQPTFASTYDAGALMVRHDETHWAKLCFEATDFGTHAAVSVVTDGLSDDANGVDLEAPSLWLQIVRVGDVFGLHYALAGPARDWRMVRYFRLALPPEVKVGLVAQSPVGPGTTVDFYQFSVQSKTVQNLRAGI